MHVIFFSSRWEIMNIIHVGSSKIGYVSVVSWMHLHLSCDTLNREERWRMAVKDLLGGWGQVSVAVGRTLHHSPWGLETKPGQYLSITGSPGVLVSAANRIRGGQVTRINISSEKLKKQKTLYPPMHRECCTKYSEWLGLHIKSWKMLFTGAENCRGTVHEALYTNSQDIHI